MERRSDGIAAYPPAMASSSKRHRRRHRRHRHRRRRQPFRFHDSYRAWERAAGQLYKLIPKHRPRGQKARLYGDLPKLGRVVLGRREGFHAASEGGNGLIAPVAEGYVQGTTSS